MAFFKKTRAGARENMLGGAGASSAKMPTVSGVKAIVLAKRRGHVYYESAAIPEKDGFRVSIYAKLCET